MNYRFLKAVIALLILFVIVISFRNTHPEIHKSALPDRIKIDGGEITGTKNSTGDIAIFRGIPFAAPPVGPLRWKAPQPVIPWKGTKVCDKFGSSPMQGKPAPFSMWSEEFLIPKDPIGEDCLYLNVWTGANSAKDKKPVLVWIYGGGFASGGTGVPIYDGEATSKKGIVFVSINYRVGIFGFFAHPDLSKESGRNASGNYGIMDQIAALQWVQKNIAVFGGDPDNVTIAGQSAGSMSVNCLTASPLAKGLFKKAIAESGALFTNSSTRLPLAEEEGKKIAQSLNVNSIDEMRNLPAEELLKKGAGFRGPIVDGYVLPDAIVNIFKAGKENKIELLTGWNQDEGFMFGPGKNAIDYQKEVNTKYGADAPVFLKYYPAQSDSEAAVSQLNFSRDMIFGAQNFEWATVQSAGGGKVFVYRFIRKPPATGQYLKFGAFHTAEVPYAYDNLKFVNRPWEQADADLAKTMSTYFANFVSTGNPNGPGLPNWDAYSNNSPVVMFFSENPHQGMLPDKDQLEFVYKKLNNQ